MDSHETAFSCLMFAWCRGGTRTVMVTGDYQNTAIAVARAVGMIPMGDAVLTVQAKSEKFEMLPGRPSTATRRFLRGSSMPNTGRRPDFADQPAVSEPAQVENLAQTLPLVTQRTAPVSQLFEHSRQPPPASFQTRGHDNEFVFTLDTENQSQDLSPQQALTSLAQVMMSQIQLASPALCVLRAQAWISRCNPADHLLPLHTSCSHQSTSESIQS